MRIQVVSDLHHELQGAGLAHSRPIKLEGDADVLVLAGNVHLGNGIVGLYGAADMPVVFVHGNHELHGCEIEAARRTFRQRAVGTSVKYLEKSEFLCGNTRFLGCCLWSDYAASPYPVEIAMREANRFMVDHRLIFNRGAPFTAEHAARDHQIARAWIEQRAKRPFRGRTVVVTHHAPSVRSIPSNLRGDALGATLGSALDDLVALADVWVHGHVHNSLNYEIGGARVVCNARGYPWNTDSIRHPFDPGLVIDV